MALLEIVKWPAPVLDTPADPVTEFDADLAKLVSNMFETMYAAPGVGLAAVQVGVPQRLFVMDCSGGKDPSQRVALINPEVLRVEGNQNGEWFELDGMELTARCMLHETDHCDGIVFLDKMSAIKREIVKRKIKKLQKAGKWD